MTRSTLLRAFYSCRIMWFASGCPMDRSRSALRRRYVYLYNRIGDTR